jgi:thiamine kinase-like enzyme
LRESGGSCAFGGAEYFLMEYCLGEDLRRCEREKLRKALDALIEMQGEFWQREELYDSALTLVQSLAGIENRGRYLGSKRLEEAYAAFVRIYQATPRTLCHDDLLPFNLLIGERAVLIDWEYGGILPYPSSFARLIAHGRQEEGVFFYMTQDDRNSAIQYYYDGLVRKHGIPFAEYRRTLDYFLFYEYCEWVMLGNRYDNRSDERYGYYRRLAEELAGILLRERNEP